MRTLVTILVMAVVFCPLTANGTIINIPGDYPTIQEGIDHSSGGDTVLVEPDIYYENLNFNGHNVVLASLFLTTGDTAYIATTTIDGDSTGRAITFSSEEDSTARVVGFTIQKGHAYGNGGGIYCFHSSPTISDNIVRWNTADTSGGGICCRHSAATITANKVLENSVTRQGSGYWRGSGIYCECSDPVISSNLIQRNASSLGAGICFWDCESGGKVIDNTITGNLSSGINCSNSSPIIIGNVLARNVGFGISCVRYSSPVIRGNSVTENEGGGGGGIICGDYSSPTIVNNSITGNRASQGYGGGVHCYYHSRPKIRDNTISDNYAGKGGGGIYCNRVSRATIESNAIIGNSAWEDGGAISCEGHSDATITDNTISGNSTHRHGGAVYCRNAEPSVVGNVISDNRARRSGGAFYYYVSEASVISDNVIKRNFAGEHGGGLYSSGGSPDIHRNLITANSAGTNGGGIFCDYCDSRIANNTLSGNSCTTYGGGVYCWAASHPTIVNCILWGDSASNGPEIAFSHTSWPTVMYCDVQGGWQGQGNIDADPIFVGPYNEDFQLRWHSPCIDAGDPDPSYNDPDGTRNDMGAFYFNQDVDGIVEVYPLGEPIVIPPEGGDIIYDGWVFNFFGHAGRVDIWTYAFVPEMGQYGPLRLYENVRIPADSIGMNGITEHVPGAAPEGDYVFVAYVGDYPSTIIDSSCFYFAKTGSIADGIADWQTLKGWFDGGLASTGSGLPTHYALSQNYPNPFNATTIINYQVPADSHVRLEVYNTLGQKVATLLDSRQQAGYRSVLWDASTVSSGLYLYKLTAGDFTETRRMMLVK